MRGHMWRCPCGKANLGAIKDCGHCGLTRAPASHAAEAAQAYTNAVMGPRSASGSPLLALPAGAEGGGVAGSRRRSSNAAPSHNAASASVSLPSHPTRAASRGPVSAGVRGLADAVAGARGQELAEGEAALAAMRAELAAVAAEIERKRLLLSSTLLQLDEASLGSATARADAARCALSVVRERVEGKEAELAALRRQNEIAESDAAFEREAIAVSLARTDRYRETARRLRGRFGRDAPALAAMNERQRQMRIDVGCAVFDMQSVLSSALLATTTDPRQRAQLMRLECDAKATALANEEALLQRLEGRLVARRRQRDAVREALASKSEELNTVRGQAAAARQRAEAFEAKISELRARFESEAAELTAANAKLRQRWGDAGSAMVDMHAVLSVGVPLAAGAVSK